jgi:hypothetical protein
MPHALLLGLVGLLGSLLGNLLGCHLCYPLLSIHHVCACNSWYSGVYDHS